MIKLRAPKEFWSGLLFMAIGVAGVFFARDYAYGSALRMGPGYMPTVLSWCTAVLGLIILLRSFAIEGPPLERMDWRPLVLVLLAIGVFAVLITRAGLVAAILGTAIVGGLGSREIGPIELILLSIGIAIFCSLVFVVGLGQPIDLWPDWVSDQIRAWRR